jgi:spermidine synthase
MMGLVACLMLSGVSGLIYEVAWVRSLELIFGATTFAVATVLAAFMGGLAFGSWLMAIGARRLERFHPLHVYGVIEGLIGIAAILVPGSLQFQVRLFQTLGGQAHESFFWVSAIRLVLCAAVLAVPTALMGATLPIASRALTAAGRIGGDGVGTLYAFNTLGAVLGCAGAGLWLLPALGLSKTQYLAVGFNGLAGICAFALAGRSQRSAPPAALPERTVSHGAPTARTGSLLVVLYALSGLTAMVYEVAWSRLLVLVLGSSTYAYTIMLTTFMFGLALGAWLGVRLIRAVRAPVLAAGLCQTMIALGTFLGLFLAGELPFLYHLAHDRLRPSAPGLLGIQLLLASGLMILPTLGLGAMFPVTIEGLRPEGPSAPREVGRAYAWNTVGAILGSLAAGFWLVPRLGSRDTLLASLLLNALLAAIAILAAKGAAPARYRWVLLGALLVFSGNVFASAPRWRPEILSSGIFRYVDRYRGMDHATFARKAREHHGEILMFKEGLTCTVTVFRTTSSLTLAVNGKPDASVPPRLFDPSGRVKELPPGDLPTQVLVGEIPLLLAKSRERVMVIGLGSGITLGSVLAHPVDRVDCVELEDAVVQASRFFDRDSGAPLLDPRVRMIVNDARNQLLVARRDYDVIISEPSNPWVAGAASLFTREFFEIARGRLRTGGVFCQWLQAYELDAEDFRTLLRSFNTVFPHVHLFRVGSDAILVGSVEETPIRLDRILSRAGKQVRADLDRIGIHAPVDLLAHYWIGGRELKDSLPAGELNTDDNMRIEFQAPLRMLARDAEERQARDLAGLFQGRSSGLLTQLVMPAGDPRSAGEFWARLAQSSLAQGLSDDAMRYATRSLELSRNALAARIRGEALLKAGRVAEARAWLGDQSREFPRDADLVRALAGFAEREEDWAEVGRLAGIMLRLAPRDPAGRHLLGKSLYQRGDDRAAIATLAPLYDTAAPETGAAPTDLGFILGAACARAGRFADAIGPLRSYLANSPSDRTARTILAGALDRAGRPGEALAESRRLSPDAAQQAEARLRAARALGKEGRLAPARERLEEALQFEPGNYEIVLLLAATRARLGERASAIDLLERFLASSPGHPSVTGYLSQLLDEEGRVDRARLLKERYTALTGEAWQPLAGPEEAFN